MYLKRIEIQGFKSFANKTVFDFDDGVTGIVGPNGSGKSNVSDAVRWVLGEQSARQLRGGNMQDVIFAGTQTRKPQGFAYVALTLDNKDHAIALDFDEVVVSRRLYRSGESEYMLNGSVCRLKDVNELFYDTGIGKDGYSIIGQGQIDKILSTKPEDRRELFDEAVGITKFKRRKLVTERKLEAEHQNLLRITDIVNELESRVGPLARQSENAREYLRLREELKKYDVNLFLQETDSLRKELAEIEKNRTILSDDLEQANNDSDQLREQYEDLVNLIVECDSVIDETREKISDANISIGDLTGKINLYQEQIRTEKLNAEHFTARMATLNSEISAREATLSDYRRQEEEKQKEFEASGNQQSSKEHALAMSDEKIASLEKCIEEDQSAVISAMNERAEINANSEKIATLLEQLQIRKSEYVQKILKVKSELATVQVQSEQGVGKLAAIEDTISAIDDRISDAERKQKELEQEAERLTQALRVALNRQDSTRAQLETLRNLAERYEGYNNPVKKVMEQGERTGGVHGVVADLIQVEQEYEVAIETALGARIQNIVTESEEEAKKLIAYLKENRLGRATFLPLSAVHAKEWNPGTVLKETGVVGVASSLVKTGEQYRGIILQLLGRTLVADTIDHAIAIEKKYGYEYRIVTKSGESLAPGGAISGGAYKKDSNLLGRKREIEALEKELTGQEKEAKEKANQLEEKKTQIRALAVEIEKIRLEKQDALLERNTISIQLKAVQERLAQTTDDSAATESELEKVDRQIGEFGKQRSKAGDDISQLDDRHENLQKEIETAGRQLEEQRAQREELSQAFGQAQLETAALEHELSFLRENKTRVEEELTVLQEEKEQLVLSNEDSESSMEEKTAAIREAENRIEALRTEITEMERIVGETTEKKTSKAEEQRQYFEKRDAISERISQLDKDIFRLQSRQEKCEEKLENQTSYMWNEYEVTRQTAEQYREGELGDITSMRRHVGELKNGIRDLGPVNVNAIEEYKEVSERYELMKTQHDDLVAAEDQLVKIIEELDKGMRKQFLENFSKIQVEFDKVFRELFGGGTGRIELEEEDGVDLLDAGILIIAQPPGKKLQNMMQLSGGEKALTAISLLFAIQNLKPSPFALLDEIEAALDDSNVDRYARYLRRLSRNTQFIVITHRRGTMVSADRLYGITMQEKGVSTLVSVNLIEAELDN